MENVNEKYSHLYHFCLDVIDHINHYQDNPFTLDQYVINELKLLIEETLDLYLQRHPHVQLPTEKKNIEVQEDESDEESDNVPARTLIYTRQTRLTRMFFFIKDSLINHLKLYALSKQPFDFNDLQEYIENQYILMVPSEYRNMEADFPVELKKVLRQEKIDTGELDILYLQIEYTFQKQCKEYLDKHNVNTNDTDTLFLPGGEYYEMYLNQTKKVVYKVFEEIALDEEKNQSIFMSPGALVNYIKRVAWNELPNDKKAAQRQSIWKDGYYDIEMASSPVDSLKQYQQFNQQLHKRKALYQYLQSILQLDAKAPSLLCYLDSVIVEGYKNTLEKYSLQLAEITHFDEIMKIIEKNMNEYDFLGYSEEECQYFIDHRWMYILYNNHTQQIDGFTVIQSYDHASVLKQICVKEHHKKIGQDFMKAIKIFFKDEQFLYLDITPCDDRLKEVFASYKFVPTKVEQLWCLKIHGNTGLTHKNKTLQKKQCCLSRILLSDLKMMKGDLLNDYEDGVHDRIAYFIVHKENDERIGSVLLKEEDNQLYLKHLLFEHDEDGQVIINYFKKDYDPKIQAIFIDDSHVDDHLDAFLLSLHFQHREHQYVLNIKTKESKEAKSHRPRMTYEKYQMHRCYDMKKDVQNDINQIIFLMMNQKLTDEDYDHIQEGLDQKKSGIPIGEYRLKEMTNRGKETVKDWIIYVQKQIEEEKEKLRSEIHG